MSQRINISVPDEMAEMLEKHKGNFKVSKICQRALREAVMLEEIKGSEDIELLKKRIQKESELLFKPYYDEGFKDGVKEAHSFSYERFVRFVEDLHYEDTLSNRLDTFEMFRDDNCAKKNGAILDGELILGESTCGLLMDNELFLNSASCAYCEGWCSGIEFIWKQVEPNL